MKLSAASFCAACTSSRAFRPWLFCSVRLALTARMEGVLDVDRVGVRRGGNRHFVDATVSVAGTGSLEQVHALSDAIEKRVGEIVPSDVMVHGEPRAPQGEHLFEAIRAVAQRK